MQQLMKLWLHKFNQWTKTIWPALIWSAFVFVVLMIPADKLPDENIIRIPYFDKYVHFFLFCKLSFFWLKYIQQKKSSNTSVIVAVVLIQFFYGIVIECLQMSVQRQFDLIDICSNLLGILFSVIMYKRKRSL